MPFDVARLDALKYGAKSGWAALRNPGYRMTLLWRGAMFCQARRIPFVHQVLHQLILFLYSCDLSSKATVGAGIRSPHPVGIVIGDKVRIAEGCVIMQNATLGGNFGKTINGLMVPQLGSNVFIGPGAAVLGPIVIADSQVVGANAVVTRDQLGT